MSKAPTAKLTNTLFRPRQIRDEIEDLEGRLTKKGGRANYEVSVMMQKLRRELREITRLRLVSDNPAPKFEPWVCPKCKSATLKHAARDGVFVYACTGDGCDHFQQPHPSEPLATRFDVMAMRAQLMKTAKAAGLRARAARDALDDPQ